MNKPVLFGTTARLHVFLFVFVLAFDQLTKWWARARFALPDGEPDYGNYIAVLGDWIHLRLVYNYGAAFGLRPQDIMPFLHPIVFYGIFTAIALGFLAIYYRMLGPGEPMARTGLLLILAGGLGNLIDRMTQHRVTDFLDVGIPGYYPRWPVFNVADSSVFIGVILLIIPAFFSKKPAEATSAPADETSPDAPQETRE